VSHTCDVTFTHGAADWSGTAKESLRDGIRGFLRLDPEFCAFCASAAGLTFLMVVVVVVVMMLYCSGGLGLVKQTYFRLVSRARVGIFRNTSVGMGAEGGCSACDGLRACELVFGAAVGF